MTNQVDPDTIRFKMTEKEFQAQVIEMAKAFGWLVYHTWNSQHSAAGFPDLVMVRGGRLIFAELKTEKGKVSDAQVVWIMEIGSSGTEVYIWRPSDIDYIEEKLR